MGDIVIKTTKDYAAEYVAAGFSLCAIRPNHKGPYQKNWGDLTLDIAQLTPGEGLGLIHGRSGTCVVDIDDMAKAEPYFLACGINIEAFLTAPDAVQINSNRTNRAKLLYKVPAGHATLPTHKRLVDGFEFRCAARNGNAMQDVLPPSIHPETKLPYKWDGDGSFSDIPELPKEILELWLSLSTIDSIGSPSNRIKSDLDILDPMTPERWADIKSALGAIPADSRDTWINVGMALQPYENGFELWDKWASKGDSYGDNDASTVDHIWHGFDPKTITYKSIFDMATKAGWVNPAKGVFKSSQEIQRMEATFLEELAKPFVDESCEFGTMLKLGIDRPEVVPPLYFVDKWLPQGEVTLLSGHGGGGKSFVALSLAVHIALGINFGDLEVTQGIVYFLSAEDRQATLNRRLDPICAHLKHSDGSQVTVAHLQGRLFICDTTKEVKRSLYAKEKTEGLAKFAKHVKHVGASVTFIDNASNAFTGNEIDRNEVTNFLQALQLYVGGDTGSVVLIAHISKGAASGTAIEDYSGSTAWHNGVRSRLSLIPGEDVPNKPKAFTVEQRKATHSESAKPLTMVWDNGTFVPLTVEDLEIKTTARKEDEINDLKQQVFACLVEVLGAGIEVSAAGGGETMAHKTLIKYSNLAKETKGLAVQEVLKLLVLDGSILKVNRPVKSRETYFYELSVGWDLI